MSSGTLKPALKKEKAELPPRRGQIGLRVRGEVGEMFSSMFGVLLGKTEEGEGEESSKLCSPTGESGRAPPAEKSKAEEGSDRAPAFDPDYSWA